MGMDSQSSLGRMNGEFSKRSTDSVNYPSGWSLIMTYGIRSEFLNNVRTLIPAQLGNLGAKFLSESPTHKT